MIGPSEIKQICKILDALIRNSHNRRMVCCVAKNQRYILVVCVLPMVASTVTKNNGKEIADGNYDKARD